MSDPLAAAVEAAVERALERRLPELLRQHSPALATPTQGPPTSEGDRFVTLREASRRFGCHRTTLLRWERQGLITPRRKLPGQRTGWLLSEVEASLAGLSRAVGAPRLASH